MKRVVSFLLVFATVLLLAACGQTGASDKQEEVQPAVQKTEEQSETSQNGTEAAGQKTEEQPEPETETETESMESVSTQEQEANVDTKTLVVYFSCTGTTKQLAEYAAQILGADLYEIVAGDPYTEADLAYYTDGRADREQNDPDARPEISGGVGNIEKYDTIILGYPIWHGQAPRIISTFLESYDFSGKIIVPFCTSHSSGIGSSADNLHTLCSDSVYWMEGKRFEAETTKETLEAWFIDMGIK